MRSNDIGVPIAEGKTMGPLTTLQFAGITLDTVLMQARCGYHFMHNNQSRASESGDE